jgi:hypothetical protein
MSNTKGRLLLLVFLIPQTIDIKILSNYDNLSRLSNNILPILIKVIFCLYSTCYCSFITVVQDGRDGQGIFFS